MMTGQCGQVITVKGDNHDTGQNIYFENRHFWEEDYVNQGVIIGTQGVR